jgi:hypothetical protein
MILEALVLVVDCSAIMSALGHERPGQHRISSFDTTSSLYVYSRLC